MSRRALFEGDGPKLRAAMAVGKAELRSRSSHGPGTPAPELGSMRFALLALAAALPLAGAPTPGAGQASQIISGVSIERFSEHEYHFTALAYRRTDLTPGWAGLDFGLGLVPNQLRARVVLVEIDAGLARVQAVGPVALMLKGGVSSFVAMIGENEFYPGLQVGLGALVPLERRAALRLDLNRHFYFPGDGPFQLWSIGLGLVVLPLGSGGPDVP